MAKTLLVDIDFATGAKILEILDQANLRVSVAMWLYSEEHEDWRFLLCSPRLDRARPAEAYGLIHDALEKAGFPIERTPTLMVLSMRDRFVRELRRYHGKGKSFEGMRLGPEMLGGRFVEDAIVYRIE